MFFAWCRESISSAQEIQSTGCQGTRLAAQREWHAQWSEAMKASSEREPGNSTTGPVDVNPGDQAPPGSPQSGERLCPRCGGSGKQANARCEFCGGTGRVVELIGDA
jgi:DnaJ-class molecular chaperone